MNEDETEPRPDADIKRPKAVQPTYTNTDILGPAYWADMAKLEDWLAKGYDVDYRDPATGLSALHIAVGSNNLTMAKALVETHKAAFFADRFGRWPSMMAIECEASEEMTDYITQAEADFLGIDTSRGTE